MPKKKIRPLIDTPEEIERRLEAFKKLPEIKVEDGKTYRKGLVNYFEVTEKPPNQA